MIYLDNSATTEIHNEVKDTMLPYLMEQYGNPSSKYYGLANEAIKAVDYSRKEVANLLGCSSKEIFFTSGATEGNNMIIKGVADYYKTKGNHIITSNVEHPSVLETCYFLEERGYEITYLNVDEFGRINIEELKSTLSDETILVSLIWGNNELGTLNDLKEISNICHERNVMLHTDATQVIGKISMTLIDFPGITFLTCSAHKMHGPKGVGAAFIRLDKYGIPRKITPLIHGGGQERNLRSGTLPVHNIVGMGKASEIARRDLVYNIRKLTKLEKKLIQTLNAKFGEHISFNNDDKMKIPGVISVLFNNVNNEILLKNISPYIAASTGSACSSTMPSHVLEAIGLNKDNIRSTVRFSLSAKNNLNDISIFNDL